MTDVVFWILWGVTVAICLWKIAEGLIRPHRMLEWPFLACAMWAYFYGYMGYDAKIYLANYMPGSMANLGQIMALLCLMAILFGWKVAMQGANTIKPLPIARDYPFFRIWAIGLFFVLIGTAGGYSVMRAAQSGALDYQESSAYWYLLFYVGYPGLAMARWALCGLKSSARIWLLVVTILFTAAFMFPHVLTARRGPLFPAIIVLLLVTPLARRKSPNPWFFVGGLVLAGVVMLLFLQIRHVTYTGGSWSEALQTVDVTSAVTDRGEQADDNEYVNSTQVIGTIYTNGKYQYGTGHLSLAYHWIPRAIWKDKPELGQGIYSFNEMFDDVETTTGFRLLGSGASAGGVADTFVQYGFLCPVFWFGLSWVIGWVYVRARFGRSHRWLFCYVGFICASHWLISQSFTAAFVPLAFFQLVPVAVFALFDRTPRPMPVWMKRRRVPNALSTPQPAVTP